MPELVRLSRGWGGVLLRLLGASAGPSGADGTLATKLFGGPTTVQHGGGAVSMAGDLARGLRDERLGALQLAASELADELSPAERDSLRTHGELPDWFIPKTKERARVIAKQLRR